jgi:hypothetical protein
MGTCSRCTRRCKAERDMHLPINSSVSHHTCCSYVGVLALLAKRCMAWRQHNRTRIICWGGLSMKGGMARRGGRTDTLCLSHIVPLQPRLAH